MNLKLPDNWQKNELIQHLAILDDYVFTVWHNGLIEVAERSRDQFESELGLRPDQFNTTNTTPLSISSIEESKQQLNERVHKHTDS